MEYQTTMTTIFTYAVQHSWVKNICPALDIKDLSNYGMGLIVTFTIWLDPSGDTLPWKEYNKENPHIVVWLEEGTISQTGVPRFEAGHGPVHIEGLSEDHVQDALLEVIRSMRLDENDRLSE